MTVYLSVRPCEFDATYQPFLVALRAVEVQQLDGNRLGLQPGLQLLIDEALVDGAEPALAEEVAHGEPLRGGLELREGEHVEVRPNERYREVLGRQQARRVAHFGERQPALQRLLLRDDLPPPGPDLRAAVGDPLSEAARQEGPPRLLSHSW